MNAYGILSYSSNESGGIPLSELKCFEESFGLIGSFEEFAIIIYAMNNAYQMNSQEKPPNKDIEKDNLNNGTLSRK